MSLRKGAVLLGFCRRPRRSTQKGLRREKIEPGVSSESCCSMIGRWGFRSFERKPQRAGKIKEAEREKKCDGIDS